VPISFTANVFRVMVLTLITYHFGDAAGQGFVHGFAGMVLFGVGLAMMLATDGLLGRAMAPRHRERREFSVAPAAGTTWGLPLQRVALFALLMLLAATAGQLLRPWIGAWAARHNKILGLVDRGSILLAVYSAFGAAVVEGIWHLFPLPQLGALVLVNAILLGLVLAITTFGSRLFGFARADEIVIVFCGSKKSLAAGIPMATVLFGASTVGVVLLPIMIFHQMQLMVCAVLARRYAAAQPPATNAVPAAAE